MSELFLSSFPSLSTAKPSYPFLSFTSRPLRISFTASSSTSSFLSVRKIASLLPLVARTSDWAQLEQGEEGGELGLSDWEGGKESGGGGVVAEGEADEDGFSEGGKGEEEEVGESYPEPPEEAKLFVGNLPFDMDSESLAKLFDQAGVVEISEVIYNRNTDQSRGFGFVTMRTVEESEKAVEMFDRYDCNGRLLTVNKAAPRGSPPERAPREFAPSFRIYVGNLPWQVDDARLEQVFGEHGKVVDARVIYDRESGRSRGFGFVTMATSTEQDDAIAALDGQSLDGRAIRVNVAEERPRRSSF